MAVERNMQPPRTGRTGAKKLPVLISSLMVGVCAFAATATGSIDNTATATGYRNGNPFSDTSFVSVPVAPLSYAISLDKQATLNNAVVGSAATSDVGDTIAYTFDVTNTGSQPLTNVAISDLLGTASGEYVFGDVAPTNDSIDAIIDASFDTLAPGDTARFSFNYTLDADDIAAGQVINTATARGSTDTSLITSDDSTTTPLNVTSSLSLAKTAVFNDGGDGRADPGDEIAYTFTVSNTGQTTLSNIYIDDPLVMAGLPTSSTPAFVMMAALQSGADPVMTASTTPAMDPFFLEGHALTYAPEALSHVSRLHPGGSVPPVRTGLHASRRLVVLSGEPEALKPGDLLAYYYSLTNTGEAPLTNLNVEQPGSEAFGSKTDILAPNTTDSASIIFTHALTDADISSGLLNVPAKVFATSRDIKLSLQLNDSLSLADARPLEELATATINPASVASLAPGNSAVFTATYAITQSDIDAAFVNNTAEANGTAPGNTALTDIDGTSTTLPPLPSIALIKTGTVNLGPDNVASIGDTISYAFQVQNTGNVTLTNVTVTDPEAVMSGGPIASLAPGAINTTTFTAIHTLTQADVDAGEFANQATASGKPPGTQAIVTDVSDDDSFTENQETITSLTPEPRISLVKSGTLDMGVDGIANLGDVINYTFTVKNTGNVTLTNVVVTDPEAAVVGGPLASLAAGATDTATFTATYTLTQADIDAGEFENQATVTANPPNAAPAITDLSDDNSETEDQPTVTTITRNPGIALLKTVSAIADTNTNSVTDQGDVISYAFEVVNTGNVTLTNVTITDPNATIVGGPIASLAPGDTDTLTFVGTHAISLADAEAGRVTNQATATGIDPENNPVTDLSDTSDLTEDDATVTPVTVAPSIALIKRATGILNTNNNGLVDAGDTLTYEFEVQNTGNVPLTNVTITDPLAGIALAGGPIAQLDAGETDTTTFTATYVLTNADIAAGQVVNQATVFGTTPDTGTVQDLSHPSNISADEPTIVTVANAPEVALVKIISGITDSNSNNLDDAGDVINYAFTVTNTGNTPLSNVRVTDTNAVVAGGPIATLAVAASDSTTFTATHIITQADMDAGGVNNQALVTADAPDDNQGRPVTVNDSSDESNTDEDDPTYRGLNQAPAIALVKTISSVTDTNGNGRNDVGDRINYAFSIHNTGNVTLTNVTLTDPNAVVSGGPIASLAVGASNSTTFTAVHVVTDEDAEAEEVVNQATASGVWLAVALFDISDSADVTGNSPTVISISAPLPTLTKSVAKSEVKRGDSVSYTITATNLREGPYDVVDLMPPAFNFITGSATVNGTAVTAVENGNALTFANITPVDGRITVKLKLLATTTLNTGRSINRAQLILSSNGDVLARAQVAVTIKDEPIFDCGEIIGRVFDDLNGNGYADDGEPGLPGVRVVTVKGLLVTTDARGRFHVPCADIPDAFIGSNFIMKLDTRTLPQGYRLTTENPRDVRLTRGKVVKLNFGATRDRTVSLDIKKDAFIDGELLLNSKWLVGMDRLVDILEQSKGSLNITYRCGQYAPIADARVKAVANIVKSKWADRGNDRDLKINARVECGK